MTKRLGPVRFEVRVRTRYAVYSARLLSVQSYLARRVTGSQAAGWFTGDISYVYTQNNLKAMLMTVIIRQNCGHFL